jgi:hypothetical protein
MPFLLILFGCGFAALGCWFQSYLGSPALLILLANCHWPSIGWNLGRPGWLVKRNSSVLDPPDEFASRIKSAGEPEWGRDRQIAATAFAV